MKKTLTKKTGIRIVAAALAVAAFGSLAGCASDTSYGVSYRDGYNDGPHYRSHYYRPYYERYYGPRSSFSFSYRD